MELNRTDTLFVLKEEIIDEEIELLQTKYHDIKENCQLTEELQYDAIPGTKGSFGLWNERAIKEEWLEDVKLECGEEDEMLNLADTNTAVAHNEATNMSVAHAGITWQDINVKEEPCSDEECVEMDTMKDIENADYEAITSSQCSIQKESYRQSNNYASRECDYEFRSTRTFGSHVSNHNGTGEGECDYISNSSSSSNVHHQTTSKYSCYTCDYRTYRKCVLRLHLKRHAYQSREQNPKQFLYCDICEFKTNQAGYLKDHMRIHTTKLYSCAICNYSCSKMASLKAHMKVHAEQRPYQCSHCNFKCKNGTELKNHIHTHTGLKRLSCDACEFRTNRSSNLTAHIRRKHTGEKPFSCEDCDYKSTSASDLRRHVATHTGRKLFACEFCDYKCSRHDVLVNHTRTHTREKPYICDVCHHKCSHLSNLVQHKRKRHTKNAKRTTKPTVRMVAKGISGMKYDENMD